MKTTSLSVVYGFLLCASLARADVLFSTTISDLSVGDDPSNVTFRISYRLAGHPLSQRLFPLFDDATWGTNDVGTTRIVTATTDPDFNDFVALMTDGHKDFIVFERFRPVPGGIAGSGQGYSEPLLFFGDDADPRVDLQGNTVDNISIYLDSTTSYIFTVSGQAIPEPSAVRLVLFGLFILVVRVLPLRKTTQ